jgi:hypothetical protein
MRGCRWLWISTCCTALLMSSPCWTHAGGQAGAAPAARGTPNEDKRDKQAPFAALGVDAQASAGKTSATIHRVQAGEPGTDGWYAARSAEGRFSVRLPNKYNDFAIHSRDNGQVGTLHLLSSVTAQGCKFVALFTTDQQGIIDRFKKDLELSRSEKSLSVSTYKNHIALESTVTARGSDGMGIAVTRRILAPHGLFMMVVTCPIAQAEYAKGNARRFFDSLSWESD